MYPATDPILLTTEGRGLDVPKFHMRTTSVPQLLRENPEADSKSTSGHSPYHTNNSLWEKRVKNI